MMAVTKFLASVTSAEEADIALSCGADIIDLKNPSTGALGALPTETVVEIVRFVHGRRPVSATVGDLPMDPFSLGHAIKAMISSGVDFVKVGIFPATQPRDCIAAISCYARATRLVAVLFADRVPDLALLPEFARLGFSGVMLDTANKASGSLLDCADYTLLEEFISRGRTLGLLTGLAGSLRLENIPSLLTLTPDYLGFRGALCKNHQRTSTLNAHNVTQIHQEISAHQNLVREHRALAI